MSAIPDPGAKFRRLLVALEAAVDERAYTDAADLTEDLMELLDHYPPPDGAALRMLLASLHDRIPRHRQSARDHMRSAIAMVPS